MAGADRGQSDAFSPGLLRQAGAFSAAGCVIKEIYPGRFQTRCSRRNPERSKWKKTMI
jgi:hypothetical protein